MYIENKIETAYKQYLEWHEWQQDKNCDYDNKPYTYEEFKFCYEDWNKKD